MSYRPIFTSRRTAVMPDGRPTLPGSMNVSCDALIQRAYSRNSLTSAYSQRQYGTT